MVVAAVLVAAVLVGAAPAPAEPAAAISPGVVLSRDSAAALQARWDLRAAAVRAQDAPKMRAGLAEVNQALLDAGIQGVPGGLQAPAIATALVREAERASAADKPDAASALLEVAESAAPDLVTVHTTRALVRWRNGDAPGAAAAVGEAIQALKRDPTLLALVGAHGLAAACVVLLLVLTVLAVFVGLPALRYVSHDLHMRLPRGAAEYQVFILVVLAAAAPFVAGAGLLFGALWVLTLTWVHITQRERFAAMAVAVVCLALPTAADWTARLLAFPSSRTARAVRAFTDISATDALREIEATQGELTLHEQLALAQAAKRAGDLELAASRYEALLKVSDDPLVHAGFGVVSALRGNEDRATQEFEKALASDSRVWSAVFNVSAFHFRRGRPDLGNAEVGRLTDEAPKLLYAFRSATFRQVEQQVTQNRAYADIFLQPNAVLRAGLERSSLSSTLRTSIERLMFAGLDGRRALFALVMFPVVWLALWMARSSLSPSCPCVRCGSPASVRGSDTEIPRDTCSQCFHAFLSRTSRIDAQIKLQKQRDIVRRQHRVAWSVVLLSMLWPGTGHLVGKATVRGVMLLTLHTLGVVTLVLAGAFISLPGVDSFWAHLPLVVPTALLLGLVWLLAVRSSWTVADDARAGRG